jgi:hypothetical protein
LFTNCRSFQRGGIALFILLACSDASRGESQRPARPRRQAVPSRTLPTPTLAFEPNLGQADARFGFVGRIGGMSFSIGPTEAQLMLAGTSTMSTTQRGPRERDLPRGLGLPPEAKTAVVTLTFAGANPQARMAGVDLLPGKVHSYLGSDPRKWTTNILRYGRVRVEGVYPGIDLVFHGRDGELEYDFVVSPGADPAAIEIAISGVSSLKVGEDGSVTWDTEAGPMRQHKPWIYQELGGRKQSVAGGYVQRNDGRLSFWIPEYDRNRTLVIDPVVSFHTNLVSGSSGVASDAAGNIYVGGFTTPSPDAVINKLGPDGALISTTLYGGSGSDTLIDLKFDRSSGQIVVAGRTTSTDLPARIGGCGSPCLGAFVTRFDTTGTPIIASYLAGGENVTDLAVDGSGNAIIVGSQKIGLQTDAYVAKFNILGDLVYRVPIGGAAQDVGVGVAVDKDGYTYVSGYTYSADFPVVGSPFQGSPRGQSDGFVTKLSPTGSILYSSYLGGTDADFAYTVAAAPNGDIVVAGQTYSPDFPIKDQIAGASGDFEYADAFVTRLSADGTQLVFSTFIGGTCSDHFYGSTIDSSGFIYLTGTTFLGGGQTTCSVGFFQFNPVAAGVLNDQIYEQAVAVKLTPEGTPKYSTFLGEMRRSGGFNVAVDGRGNALYSGYVNGARPQTDSFLVKIEDPDTQAEIEILPSTTRWKPKRDDAKNIKVSFKGPGDLDTTTVELKVTPPAGYTGPEYTPSLGTVAKASGKDDEYEFEWRGPWTFTANNQVQPMPRGNYTLIVSGKRKDSPEKIDSLEYDKVSLVEVTKVEICTLDNSLDVCGTLDANPQVASLADRGQVRVASRPSEGRRVFAERPRPQDPVSDKVKILVTIDPPVEESVPVFFRSIDVDDPDDDPIDPIPQIRDNLGGDGTVPPVAEVPANKTTVRSVLQISTKPGDNYRVVASTKESWTTSVKAHQPSLTGEVRHEDDTLLTTDEQAMVSEMLTVWRTLHFEVDSMRAAPTNPGDPLYQERNFLRGEISLIRRSPGPDRLPTQLFLLPEVTPEYPVDLIDGSLHRPNGNGRFENGVICIGADAAPADQFDRCAGAIRITGLRGNGSTYVEHTNGFSIPFELAKAGSEPLLGTIRGWNPQRREFTLSVAVRGPAFDGGALTIGGVPWTVETARGLIVRVAETKPLPFVLVDDDRLGLPISLPRWGLEESNESNLNLLAQAYIRPAYDLGGDSDLPFNRNIQSTPNAYEAYRAMEFGFDVEPRQGFAVAYVLAAHQGNATQDTDPNREPGELGVTTDVLLTEVGQARGSIVYVETGRDSHEMVAPGVITTCLARTIAHEVGHQFRLEPEHGAGVMIQGCLTTAGGQVGMNPVFYTADHLRQIRSRMP